MFLRLRPTQFLHVHRAHYPPSFALPQLLHQLIHCAWFEFWSVVPRRKPGSEIHAINSLWIPAAKKGYLLLMLRISTSLFHDVRSQSQICFSACGPLTFLHVAWADGHKAVHVYKEIVGTAMKWKCCASADWPIQSIQTRGNGSFLGGGHEIGVIPPSGEMRMWERSGWSEAAGGPFRNAPTTLPQIRENVRPSVRASGGEEERNKHWFTVLSQIIAARPCHGVPEFSAGLGLGPSCSEGSTLQCLKVPKRYMGTLGFSAHISL